MKHTEFMDKEDIAKLAVATADIENMKRDIGEIKSGLNDLPEKLTAMLDERYAKAKDVAELKETVAPLTDLRRKLWQWAVVGIILSIAYVQFAKDKIGSLLP